MPTFVGNWLGNGECPDRKYMLNPPLARNAAAICDTDNVYTLFNNMAYLERDKNCIFRQRELYLFVIIIYFWNTLIFIGSRNVTGNFSVVNYNYSIVF